MKGNQRKTLLLLGGSRQQVVAIETAKRLGFRTVVCDYLPDNPGRYTADVYYPASTTNREEILAIACKEKADGVIAYASDPASPTAAFVAKELGLPANPLESVETMSSKHLFRRHLLDNGFPCPASMSFASDIKPHELVDKLHGLNFPIMVKPTDSSGSKGVTLVRSDTELKSAMQHAECFSRNGILIAEEYIDRTFPHVIGGDIFVVDGEVRFWGLMNCQRRQSLELLPIGKRAPSGLTAEQRVAIKATLQRLINSLGICFGELNVEILIGRDNIPYVLELAPRAGGNMIPIQLSDISGINLVEAGIRCAMGESLKGLKFDVDEGCCSATHVMHSLTDGILREYWISSEMRQYVYRKVMYVSPGDTVERFDGANKAIGIAFMRFPDEGTMNNLLSDLDRHFRPILQG